MVYILNHSGFLWLKWIMFTLLQVSGMPFSEKRAQINKINYYLEKINNNYKSDPEKALKYANKICTYCQDLLEKGKVSSVIELWTIDTPPLEIKRKIELLASNSRLRKNIIQLSTTAKLSDVYSEYHGKDSFRALLQRRLNTIDEGYEVISLESGNNPIVQVNQDGKSFIIRFLRVSRGAEKDGYSPRIAREQLDGIQQIPQPFLLELAEQDDIESTYMEFGEFYEQGNLLKRFENLYIQKQKKIITSSDFEKTLLSYAKRMVEFYILINEKRIWYTDLKPSNILINDNDEIIISDVKGLIISDTPIVITNRTSTSPAYYQSSVFINNQIDLELVQCQTLAVTLYQLACGALPEQIELNKSKWKNNFDFNHAVFRTPVGEFLQKLIVQLNKKPALSMPLALAHIKNQLLIHEEFNEDVALEDSDSIMEMLPPLRPGYNYTKLD